MTPEDLSLLFQKIGFPDFSSLSSENFCQGAALLLGVEASLLENFEPNSSLLQAFPAALAQHYQTLPLYREKEVLYVALVHPFDTETFSRLRFILQEPIQQLVAPPEKVQELLKWYCTLEEKSSTPIADHVEALLSQALSLQASDLHLEPLETSWNLRYRVDGSLQEHPPLSNALGLAIVSRLKLMAHLNIAEQRRAQDGRFEYSPLTSPKNLTLKAPVAFRVATLPTQYGESLVLRLLDRRLTGFQLESLPFPKKIKTSLLKVLHQPHGLFIVTGPTGSGKTTTLYACLQHLHRDAIKIATIEDPIEYELEGALQIPVNEAAGLSFSRALRSLLRHDPDIIMIGETRDTATTSIALQAALTGHRVFTTLHTNDTVSTIPRLLELKALPSTIASVLRGILAQRLLRTLCTYCRQAYHPEEKLLTLLNLPLTPHHFLFYRGRGCDACQQTGYNGRYPIFEWLPITPEIEQLLHQNASPLLLREKAIEQGMIPLRAEAIQMLLKGTTTAEEVLQWT